MKSHTSSTAVCIIVENLPVPLDRRVWKEACALRDAGYRVSVICPKSSSLARSYEILDGIEIYRHHAIEASGVLGYFLEYTWALLAEFFLALKVYLRTRYRVLHASNPPDTIFLIALVLKLFGVRFIFDQHDLSPELFEVKFGKRAGILQGVVRFFEYWSFRIADVSIATNESFRQIAIVRGKRKPENVFVVRNSPDLAVFRAPAADTRKKVSAPLLVTYVGFMGSQDGLELLVDSIEEIVHANRRRDTHFALIGGGTVLDELRAMVQHKGLTPWVTISGQVTHEEVAAWLASSDIGVAPDPKNVMNDKLTMIKILEYMAFSLPVVLFDLEEGRHIADAAALYATPNDPVDFAAKINSLLDCGELRRQLGATGRKRIEERLNWEVEKTSLLCAYNTALGRNGTW